MNSQAAENLSFNLFWNTKSNIILFSPFYLKHVPSLSAKFKYYLSHHSHLKGFSLSFLHLYPFYFKLPDESPHALSWKQVSKDRESACQRQVAHLVHINFLLSPDAGIPTDLASGTSDISCQLYITAGLMAMDYPAEQSLHNLLVSGERLQFATSAPSWSSTACEWDLFHLLDSVGESKPSTVSRTFFSLIWTSRKPVNIYDRLSSTGIQGLSLSSSDRLCTLPIFYCPPPNSRGWVNLYF